MVQRPKMVRGHGWLSLFIKMKRVFSPIVVKRIFILASLYRIDGKINVFHSNRWFSNYNQVIWFWYQLNFIISWSSLPFRHVLTAAHCYRPDLYTNFEIQLRLFHHKWINFVQYLRAVVRVGDHDRSTTNDGEHEDIPITHVEKHAAYNISGDAKNDIMILYLKRDIKITGKNLIVVVDLHSLTP